MTCHLAHIVVSAPKWPSPCDPLRDGRQLYGTSRHVCIAAQHDGSARACGSLRIRRRLVIVEPSQARSDEERTRGNKGYQRQPIQDHDRVCRLPRTIAPIRAPPLLCRVERSACEAVRTSIAAS